MSAFQSAIDNAMRAAQDMGAVPSAPETPALSGLDYVIADAQKKLAQTPGRTDIPELYAPDLQREAAQEMEGVVDFIPDMPIFAGLSGREIARGAVGAYMDAAHTLATPGMRSQFFRSLLRPTEAMMDAWDWIVGNETDPKIRDLAFQSAADYLSLMVEPGQPTPELADVMLSQMQGRGLQATELPTEIIAMRGTTEGLAAGQREGYLGDIARGVGQSLPQFAAMAATGGGSVPVSIAAQVLIPLSSYSQGVQEAIGDLERERRDKALAGEPLPEINWQDVRTRAEASMVINTAVEAGGAAVGARAIGKIGGRLAATSAGRGLSAALSRAGAAQAARNLTTRPAAAAFARITNGANRITPGFLRNTRDIMFVSGLEEAGEEGLTAVLQAPFTYAPLSEDLTNGLRGMVVGFGAGGAGGVGVAAGVKAKQTVSNLRDSFRAETDADIIARNAHTDAIRNRVDWTKELQEQERDRIAVSLQSMNGMTPDERGRFLRDLNDRKAQADNYVERLLEERRQKEEALAGIASQEAAGAVAPEGMSFATLRDLLTNDIDAIDSDIKAGIRDRVFAEAHYNAAAEKMLDMPQEVQQAQVGDVLGHVGRARGIELTAVETPKNGQRLQQDMEALGMKVVWFKPASGNFSPAFHSKSTRGVIYLNANADMRQARAYAFEEMFHDLQMFRPDIARAYMHSVGMQSVYQAGVEYVARSSPESAGIQRMDDAAIAQATAVAERVAEQTGAIAPTEARRGAARLEQEGAANLFAPTAAALGERTITGSFMRLAARMGLSGREARAAVAVLDTVSRAAAVQAVEGTAPAMSNELSELGRTLGWAQDLNVSYARGDQGVEVQPKPKAAAKAKAVPEEGAKPRPKKPQPQEGPVESAKALVEYAGREATRNTDRFFKEIWPTLLNQTTRQLKLSPQNFRRAAQRAIADLEVFLRDNPKYADYYAKDWKATEALLSDYLKRPITADEFMLFRVLSGLCSPNTKLPSNQRDAVNLTLWWINNGNFDAFQLGPKPKTGTLVIVAAPLQISSTTANAKLRSIKVVESLTRKFGSVVAAVKHLEEMVPQKELNKFKREMGYKSNVANIGNIRKLVQQATGQSELIPRMFIFGQKVGAYTLNAIGDGRFTTVDIWESRHIRSYFEGMFEQNTGLPVTTTEHDVFTRFNEVFREEFEKATGQSWQPSALQAVRWFYIIDAAKRAGYTAASTNETISVYTERSLRALYGYGRTDQDGGQPGDAARGRRSRARTSAAPAANGGGVVAGTSFARGGDGGGVGAVRSLAPLEGSPRVAGATGPDPGLVSVAERYAADNGITLRRQSEYAQADPERGARIAAAYAAMKHQPNDPVVREAYENLIKQTMAQYRALEDAGYQFWFYDGETDPYDGKPWNAMRDLRANRRMAVFATEGAFGSSDADVSDNPLLADTGLQWAYGSPDGPMRRVLANDLFRAVHDAFGHGLEGAGFRAQGEENAWQAHVRLFTGSAIAALTSETRGQNSWLNFGPHGEKNQNASVLETTFADQKTGLMPSWTWTEGRVGDVSYARRQTEYQKMFAPDFIDSVRSQMEQRFGPPDMIVPSRALVESMVDAEDPEQRKFGQVAAVVHDVLDATMGDVSGIPISIYPPGSAYATDHGGSYYPHLHEMAVVDSVMIAHPQVIPHELVHAVTFSQLFTHLLAHQKSLVSAGVVSNPELHAALTKVLRYGQKFSTDYVDAVQRVRDGLMAELDPAVSELLDCYLQVAKHPGFGPTNGAKFYGMTNVLEFVSEAMSDLAFQGYLSALPSRTRGLSMFDKFVNAVRDLLGLQSLPKSLLTDVIRLTEEIASRPLTSNIREVRNLYYERMVAQSKERVADIRAEQAQWDANVAQARAMREEARTLRQQMASMLGVSFGRSIDDEYLSAIRTGDMAAVQQMVDDAARASGWETKAWHNTPEDPESIDIFRSRTAGSPSLWFWRNKTDSDRATHLGVNQIPVFLKLGRSKVVDYSAQVDDRESMADATQAMDEGFDSVILENAFDGTMTGDQVAVFDAAAVKSAAPITRDASGNVIPLSKRFDVTTADISFARPSDDPEVSALRQQIADLTRQIRDVQNVTAAQRVNALREVRILQRQLAAAELLASQKVGQAQRAAARVERMATMHEETRAAADKTIAELTAELDAAETTIRRMRQEARAASNANEIAQLEAKIDRVSNWAYAIGRNEGLFAGQVQGQQQIRRTEVRPLQTRLLRASERITLLQTRLASTRSELVALRQRVRVDAAAAQRAIDFAYRIGLRTGRREGGERVREQMVRRMEQREAVLQRRMDRLRELMNAQRDVTRMRNIAQQMAREAAMMIPQRLRGPLTTRIAMVRTIGQANRVAIEAMRAAANAEVAQGLATIARVRRQMGRHGMRANVREQIEAMLAQADATLRQANRRRLRVTVAPVQNAEALRIRAEISTRLATLRNNTTLTRPQRRAIRLELVTLRQDLRTAMNMHTGGTLVNAIAVATEVGNAAALVEQAAMMYAADRAAWVAERNVRVQRYADLTNRLTQNMQGRRLLPMMERADKPPRIGLVQPIQRANADIYTLMLEIEGVSDGVINEMLEAAQAGKGESALEHAAIMRQMQPALAAAGYSGLDEYALRNGLMGDASAVTMDVTLGGEARTLPVGVVMSVAAMDDETLALFGNGQPNNQGMKFRDAETVLTIYPTQQEILAARAALTPGQRGMIDAMKQILEFQIRDRTMEAIWLVEGDQPPIVPNYWPRIRSGTRFGGERRDILQASGALVRGALTSVGFANARTGGTEPLVYSDAFQTWDRHVQVALDMIHMAQPYRDAATVLSDRNVQQEMDRRGGAGTAEAVMAIFSNGVGATARSSPSIIDALTSNVTGAVLAMSPRTWAKIVIGGQIRLASEIPTGYWATGVARATASLRNPMAWRNRVNEIHLLNGYFSRRHQLQFRTIVSGALSDQDRVRVLVALEGAAASMRVAGQSVIAGRMMEALKSFRDASNGGNLALASVIDALRYMDEQIMLVAVEARLSEVEDEGLLTGQDALREAALRAERDFRRTQNASDEFDESSFASTQRVRGNTGWRFFFPFSSDPLKARNQLRRAFLSGEGRLRAVGAVGGNLAASTAISTMSVATTAYMVSLIAALFGGDDDPNEELKKQAAEDAKRIPVNIAAEVISSTMGYTGIVIAQTMQAMQYNRTPMVPVAGRPVEQSIREGMKIKDDPMQIIPALLALTQLAGFPGYQMYNFIRGLAGGDTKTKAAPQPKQPKTAQQEAIERIQRRVKALQQSR